MASDEGAAGAADGWLTETAFAKVNLALHVRRRRNDGYHEIESLFAFVDQGDLLQARSRDDGELRLSLDGPFAMELVADRNNLVLRAATALRQAAGVTAGAEIRLTKHLPVASGIGGGSADAAAAARLLNRLWRLEWPVERLVECAGGLGADIPACLWSRTMAVRGIGDRLEPYDAGVAGMPILLVNPMKPCATGPVFAGWDRVDRGALDWDRWGEGRNDLAPAARRIVPEIGEVLDELAAIPGAEIVRMSGSGATCLALFADVRARDAAEQAVRGARPGWWTMTGRLK